MLDKSKVSYGDLQQSAEFHSGTLRASVRELGYINFPFLNTGSVSGTQYLDGDTIKEESKEVLELNKSILQMDDALNKAFSKYASYLK